MEFHLFDWWCYKKEPCFEIAIGTFKSTETDFNKALFWIGYNKIAGFELEILFIRIR